jgi:hypothetical protein
MPIFWPFTTTGKEKLAVVRPRVVRILYALLPFTARLRSLAGWWRKTVSPFEVISAAAEGIGGEIDILAFAQILHDAVGFGREAVGVDGVVVYQQVLFRIELADAAYRVQVFGLTAASSSER